MFQVELSDAEEQCFTENAETREMSSHFAMFHSALI